MTPELEYIEIIFENTDFVRIPSSFVLGMSLEKISNYLWANFSHQLIEENVCENFEIDLDNQALKYQTHFQNITANGKYEFKYHLDTVNDITHINIKPNTRESIYIAVPWESDDMQNTKNLYQKTIFQEDSFIISCKKENKIWSI
jgi:hypothetical protein